MKSYIFYETGNSCRAEFRFKNEKFQYTEDAVVIGISSGENPEDALKRLVICSPWINNYMFDRVVSREVGDAVYL